jgi:hypothetical protein
MRHVFISYAHEDQEVALGLRERLIALGFTVWVDTVDLLGGQDWEVEIKKALRESSHVITLISANSVTKRGYVQKELREALDLLDEFPPGAVFVVPVRLDDSHPSHERLAKLQWIDLYQDFDAAINRIETSLRHSPAPPASSPPRTAESVPPEAALPTTLVPPTVLARAPLTAALRSRLTEPFDAVERFRRSVRRLVDAGKWVFTIGVGYPPELLQAEEHLDTALSNFASELRNAADEIDREQRENAERFGILGVAGNLLYEVRQALLAAAAASEQLYGLRSQIKGGAETEALRTAPQYQAATSAINNIEDQIKAAEQKRDQSVRLFKIYGQSNRHDR